MGGMRSRCRYRRLGYAGYMGRMRSRRPILVWKSESKAWVISDSTKRQEKTLGSDSLALDIVEGVEGTVPEVVELDKAAGPGRRGQFVSQHI